MFLLQIAAQGPGQRASSSPRRRPDVTIGDMSSDFNVIVTGIVGAMGIAGTLFGTLHTNRSQTANLETSIHAQSDGLMTSLQAQREELVTSLLAQRDAARRADMQAHFAAYMSRVNAMATALNAYPEDGDVETKRAYAATELRQAMQLLFDAHNDLILTAPEDVSDAVGKVTAAYEDEYYDRKGDGARRRTRTHADRLSDRAFELMKAALKAAAVRGRLEE
jgi:hypothetical protein